MTQELEVVTEWLLCASSQIAQEYMWPRITDRDDPVSRERVYCYELYHRWRCHWPSNFQFSLNGEIDKINHPIFPDDAPKPDFLVHVPGEPAANLLVMEVKPGNVNSNRINDLLNRMLNDLKKLTKFKRDLSLHGQAANYEAAYFWIYGLEVKEWPTLRRRLLSAQRSNEFDPDLIDCFIHEKAGTRALQVLWN